nr:hypothetical protein [Micromonospora sp. DSM 115978]
MMFEEPKVGMLGQLAEVTAHELGADEYLDDFWRRFQQTQGVCWKLERQQHFESPEVPSWVAMNDGDWLRALRLMDEQMRKSVHDDFVDHPNLERRRLRIVEPPLSPYLQWELNVFRLRVEAGERIRVLEVDQVRDLERIRALPEVVTLGGDVLYEVHYSPRGTYLGARRIDDSAVVAGCIAEITSLFARAEDFAAYYERE